MQEESAPRTNAARAEATRAALIASARTLFVEKGYAETSTPEIVRHAGVTRGALYHHFTDKADLFRTVLRGEFEAVTGEIERASQLGSSSGVQALLLGGEGFLQAMRSPGRVRIMLLDGPAVLGREEVDRIDRETSADALREGLKAAMEKGEIIEAPLDALTAQLSAMFDRAALGIASGEDAWSHKVALEKILRALERRR
jgi:AcrR family transcriptional regulator